MKKLLVYMENDEFVIERVNGFNHATKRFFSTENGLFEGLQAYRDVLDEYELEVSDPLWAKVINFLNSHDMSGGMNVLLVLHKKMYDICWNAAEGDPAQLEKDFIALAEREGVDLERINEMLHQLYIPPYNRELLPEHLKSKHGGKREGAGRPSLGTTKKVSLTLPDEIWDMIEQRKDELGVSQSQTLRMMIEGYFHSSEDE